LLQEIQKEKGHGILSTYINQISFSGLIITELYEGSKSSLKILKTAA
jgi:hypothetical protein